MTDTGGSLGSARVRGLAALVVVFVAGGVAGGAIDRIWVTPLPMRTAGAPTAVVAPSNLSNNDRPLLPSGAQNAQGAKIEIPMSLRSVALTAAQREKIVAIVARLRPRADSIMQSLRPRVVAIDLQMRQEAMCVLTQEQRDGWIAYRKREHLNVEEGNIMMKLVTGNQCPPDN